MPCNLLKLGDMIQNGQLVINDKLIPEIELISSFCIFRVLFFSFEIQLISNADRRHYLPFLFPDSKDSSKVALSYIEPIT